MRPKLLYILLVLALLAGNMALSGHLPGHKVAGSEVCSLCVHAAAGGNAVVDNDNALPVISPVVSQEWHNAVLPVLSVRLYDQPSRAPPYSI